MELKKAGREDLNRLVGFYEEVCEALETAEYTPDWHMGVYPAVTDIEIHIENGEMYFAEENGKVTSAFVLTESEDPMYAEASWQLKTAADKVAVLHLFAVHPTVWRKHYSREVLRGMFNIARRNGAEVIHLDVVPGNLPAEKTYRSLGFRFAERYPVHYDDIGDTEVDLYEYDLREGH